MATARTLLGGGREEDLDRRVGKDHRPDVAALGDKIAPLSDCALRSDHGGAHAGGRVTQR